MGKVTIGGVERPVPDVNTRKVTVGARIWSHLQEHINDAMLEVAKFNHKFGEANPLPITRERNVAGNWGFTDEDFKDRPYIEVPALPSGEQQLAVGFAFVYDKAEDEIAKLCALVLASRQEVREHRKAGDLNEWLLEEGQDLIDDSDPEEILDVMTEVVKQFKARKKIGEALGKLRQEFSSPDSPSTSQAENSASSTPPEHRQTEVKVATVTEDEQEDATSPNTTSSISSPTDTSGQPITS